MKILIVGCDKGSWQMRGRQIAHYIGAQATAKPQPWDWSSADIIVLVKRAAETWFRQAKSASSRAVIVWDVLDYWRQPSANQQPAEEYIRYVTQTARSLKARAIGATKAMAHDIDGVYLPHHSRIGLKPAPVRPKAEVVAYEGAERYLGSWRPALERACNQLGLRFVVNPPDLSAADIIVAFRGEQWDGWVCRQWKSGVKYGNAIAAGRPILTQDCAAFREIQPPGGVVVEHHAELVDAIARVSYRDVREAVYAECLTRLDEFHVETIARRYMRIVDWAARNAAA